MRTVSRRAASIPQERMTREEALRSYTIEGAYATFTEQQAGSIEVGQERGLRDPLARHHAGAGGRDPRGAKVLYTIVGGRMFRDAGGAPAAAAAVTYRGAPRAAIVRSGIYRPA